MVATAGAFNGRKGWRLALARGLTYVFFQLVLPNSDPIPVFTRMCSAGVSPASLPGVPPGDSTVHASKNWYIILEMKPTNTCLILGAGASVPWDYPLGAGLRSELIRLVRKPRAEWSWIASQKDPRLPEIQDRAQQLMRDFAQTNEDTTIDYFLGKLNPEAGDEQRERYGIGKVLIAGVIRLCENPDLDVRDWYGLLFEHHEHASTLNIAWPRIITFNYDRSLEYYLSRFHSEKNGLPEEAARQALIEKLQPLHVYGGVGELPRSGLKEGVLTFEYGRKVFWGHDAHEARNLFQIIEREDFKPEAFLECKRWITEAKYVIILGFGFDKQNCGRLDLAEAAKGKRVFTTAFDKKAREDIGRALPASQIEFGNFGESCLKFLHRTQALKLALNGQT